MAKSALAFKSASVRPGPSLRGRAGSNHLCCICEKRPARPRTPTCANCAQWWAYHAKQDAFSYTLYVVNTEVRNRRLAATEEARPTVLRYKEIVGTAPVRKSRRR